MRLRMSIHLSYVKGPSKKLRRILRSHKMRSTLYTENTLGKLTCKPKDGVAKEDKNNISYEFDCGNCKAVHFGESRRSLKLSSDVRNCDCKKNEIVKHSLRNPSPINKIFFMLPEIRLPYLR